jgi:ketosteroid isomerase-like protein
MNRTQHGIFLMLGLSLVLGSACVSAVDSSENTEQLMKDVRAVIEAQQAAWNRGDIEGYMDGYERSDTTTFISGDELTQGWQTVLDGYKRRYNSRDLMGTLTFSDLTIQPLSPSAVVANGRWQLTRAGDAPRGRFTLIFRHTPNGWRIIQDTTTSAQSQ